MPLARSRSSRCMTAIWLAFALRRLRRDQRVVLGDWAPATSSPRSRARREFRVLHEYVEEIAARLHERMAAAEGRLDGAVAYRALVRYDAYGEMSGHQSTSIALLDARRNGVVLSSILHRDQARLYAKRVEGGVGELELSPEEQEAVRLALAAAAAGTSPRQPSRTRLMRVAYLGPGHELARGAAGRRAGRGRRAGLAGRRSTTASWRCRTARPSARSCRSRTRSRAPSTRRSTRSRSRPRTSRSSASTSIRSTRA